MRGQEMGTDSVDNTFKETVCKGVMAELHLPKCIC